MSRVLKGHSDAVAAVAFSRDGRLFASGSADGAIIIWCPQSASISARCEGHTAAVNCLAFNHDSSSLATASDDGQIRLWDTGNGSLQNTLLGHLYAVNSVVFSRDGSLMASASFDKSVKIWPTIEHGGGEQRSLLLHSDSVYSADFNHNTTLLASTSRDKTLIIWSVASGQALRRIVSIYTYFRAVSFSPDGQLLALAAGDASVKIADISSIFATEPEAEQATPQPPPLGGLEMMSLHGHTKAVFTVAWSPDGAAIASGSGDQTVRIWTRRAPPDTPSPAASAADPTAHVPAPVGGGATDTPASEADESREPPAAAAAAAGGAAAGGVSAAPEPPPGATADGGGGGAGPAAAGATAGWRAARQLRHAAPVLAVAWDPGGCALAAGDDLGHVTLWDLAGAARRLALAMGAHPRLGRASPLAALEPEHLAAIAACLPPPHPVDSD